VVAAGDAPMKPSVFVSEPTGLSNRQRQMSGQWHQRLAGSGFDVLRLGREQYQHDPWRIVLEFIDAADGVLVLGFRQLAIGSAVWRADTAERAAVDDALWTSPWMQIETGMALAAGLPVLVAAEADVREGVFARSTWTGQLSGTSVEAPCPAVVDRWASTIEARARRSLAS
jgi:hypothetical protein